MLAETDFIKRVLRPAWSAQKGWSGPEWVVGLLGDIKRLLTALGATREDGDGSLPDHQLPAPETASPVEAGNAFLGPAGSYVASVLTDFSRELGDAAHESSNQTQALMLWRQSGLDEATFVREVLQEARARTRQAQGQQGARGLANKMAYFFVVVRDIVARRSPSPDDPPNS